MTPQEYSEKLRKQISDLITLNRPLQLSVGSIVAEVSERIFTHGKNTAGETFIYDYKTPLYVNPSESPVSFQPRGKPIGSGDFVKSGKNKGKEKIIRKTKRTVLRFAAKIRYDVDLKTRWFASYADYRREIGRKVSHVNWSLSGDLQSDYTNSQLGATPAKTKPHKVNVNEYQTRFTRKINSLKAEGLEDGTHTGGVGRSTRRKKGYGKIFELSDAEKELFYDICEKELANALSGSSSKISLVRS